MIPTWPEFWTDRKILENSFTVLKLQQAKGRTIPQYIFFTFKWSFKKQLSVVQKVAFRVIRSCALAIVFEKYHINSNFTETPTPQNFRQLRILVFGKELRHYLHTEIFLALCFLSKRPALDQNNNNHIWLRHKSNQNFKNQISSSVSMGFPHRFLLGGGGREWFGGGDGAGLCWALLSFNLTTKLS